LKCRRMTHELTSSKNKPAALDSQMTKTLADSVERGTDLVSVVQSPFMQQSEARSTSDPLRQEDQLESSFDPAATFAPDPRQQVAELEFEKLHLSRVLRQDSQTSEPTVFFKDVPGQRMMHHISNLYKKDQVQRCLDPLYDREDLFCTNQRILSI